MTQFLIDTYDPIGRVTANRIDDFFIEQMRVGIVTGRSVALQTMTEIAAGNEGHGASHFLDRLPDALAEAEVIFIGKEAVAERDDAPMPTIVSQAIERHRSAVIELESLASHPR